RVVPALMKSPSAADRVCTFGSPACGTDAVPPESALIVYSRLIDPPTQRRPWPNGNEAASTALPWLKTESAFDFSWLPNKFSVSADNDETPNNESFPPPVFCELLQPR